ncbi:hypothetical protein D3C87_1131020 [compost metagenome]
MGFAAGDDDGVALFGRGRGLLQVLGQAAGIALRCRLGGRTQPFAEPLFHAAEMHLGQRLAAEGADLGQVLAQLGRVLLGAPDRHVDPLRHLAQARRVARCRLAFEDRRHQPRLVIDQDELGLRGVEQHGLLLSGIG